VCSSSERSRTRCAPKTLGQRRQGSILVNISRGPIVEEERVEALRSGHLAVAGLDVFDRSRSRPTTRSGHWTTCWSLPAPVTEQGFGSARRRMAET
jgi:lactate dehydrogenase-like 2-hydroxyacid dehydrogenase